MDESILIGEKALAASSAEHEWHAVILGHLSLRFNIGFKSQGALADLKKSIELSERAVTASRPGDRDRSYGLSIFSSEYLERYAR